MRFGSVALSGILLILLSISASARADQIFVEPATGSGVTDSDLTTTTTLIISAVGEVASETVTTQADQADLSLRPTLVRLGQAYLLGLSKVKAGKIVYSSQLKAEKMDELDKVAVRLTRSVLIGERAKDNPRVGEITNEETHEGTQRRPTRSETYFAFGGTVFGNLNSTGMGYSVGLGHAWDINRALIKLTTQFDLNGEAWMWTGGIGANYFFLTTDMAPYVTGDFGAGVAKLDGGGLFTGQTVGGFAAGGGAGVQFFRTSSINLDLGLHITYILTSNALGFPASYAVRLGIYF